MEDEQQVARDVRFITLLDVTLQLTQEQRKPFLYQACATAVLGLCEPAGETPSYL